MDVNLKLSGTVGDSRLDFDFIGSITPIVPPSITPPVKPPVEPPLPGDNDQSPLGINLAPVLYWSSELPFVDAFKLASEWSPQTRGGGES